MPRLDSPRSFCFDRQQQQKPTPEFFCHPPSENVVCLGLSTEPTMEQPKIPPTTTTTTTTTISQQQATPSTAPMVVSIGIDGGASSSTLKFFDSATGECLASFAGAGMNPWATAAKDGFDAAANVVVALIINAAEKELLSSGCRLVEIDVIGTQTLKRIVLCSAAYTNVYPQNTPTTNKTSNEKKERAKKTTAPTTRGERRSRRTDAHTHTHTKENKQHNDTTGTKFRAKLSSPPLSECMSACRYYYYYYYYYVSSSAGLAISGIATASVGDRFAASVRARASEAAATSDFATAIASSPIFVHDDLFASLRSVVPATQTAVMLISGTGSNCLLYAGSDGGDHGTDGDGGALKSERRVQTQGELWSSLGVIQRHCAFAFRSPLLLQCHCFVACCNNTQHITAASVTTTATTIATTTTTTTRSDRVLVPPRHTTPTSAATAIHNVNTTLHNIFFFTNCVLVLLLVVAVDDKTHAQLHSVGVAVRYWVTKGQHGISPCAPCGGCL